MDSKLKKITHKKLFSKINKSTEKYKMLEDGDRVLVGLSGGKDSLVLLESLALKRKKSKIDFALTAIYIDILNIPYDADVAYLKQYCEDLSVEFIHEKLMDEVDLKNTDKNPCFLCSWDRRKHLFEFAKQKDYNKLALGHHLDDAIETLFMNMMYQANISALPPILPMFEGQLTVIRPLIETKESRIIEYAEGQGFKPMVKTCPFEKVSSREFVRGILKQMEDKYDRAKNNIFLSMGNIDDEYLP